MPATIAADGVAALEFLHRYRYDAIVLDLMLPRPAGMAIGQHQVEIARRAAAFGAHRQRAAGAVG